MKIKRITALLLVFAMLLSFCPNVFADSKEQYGTLSVKWFSTEKTEPLTVMVKDNYLYVDASVLAEKFGYEFKVSGKSAIMLRDENENYTSRIIIFNTDSKDITYVNSNITIDYSMPCKAISNENGYWIPMQYILRLLDSGYSTINSSVSSPSKSALSVFGLISNNKDEYMFDIVDDLGDNQFRIAVCKEVNALKDVLDINTMSDGLIYLLSLGLDTEPYDKKYSEQLATLFCTQSQDELRELADQFMLSYDLLSDSGELADLMNDAVDTTSKNLDDAMSNFEKLLDSKTASSAQVAQAQKVLDKALNNKGMADAASQVTQNLQSNFKSSKEKSDYLSIFKAFLDFCTYYQEFESQDKTSLKSFEDFVDYLDANIVRKEILGIDIKNNKNNVSKTSVSTFKKYINNSQFKADMAKASAIKAFKDNMDSLVEITTGVDLQNKLVGTSGCMILLAWDLASNCVPFVKDGLENADCSSLATYSQKMQKDAFLWYVEAKANVAQNPYDEKLWEEYARSSYALLKICHISRENGTSIATTYLNRHKDKTDKESKEKAKTIQDYIITPFNEVDNEVVKQASFYYTLSEDFDNNDNIAYFGMIPPVEAEVKENYSSYDSEIIKQVKNLSDDYDDINNPEKLYAEVLEQYRKAINNANIVNELNYVNTTLLIDYAFPIYYAFYDIDNNGVSELLIGTTKDSSLVDIYDIFTYDGVKPIVLIKNDVGFRTKCMIYTNSYIKIYNSAPEYSGYYTKYDFYNISTDGISLDLIVNLSIKEDVNSTQYYKDNNKISKNQFNKLINKYQDSDEISLSWIELKSKKNTSKDNSNNKSIDMSNINDIVQSHYWKSMIQSLYIYSFDSNNIYYYDITDEVFDKCINNNSISSDDLKDCEKIKIGTYRIDGNTLIIKGDFNVELQYVSYSSNGDYDIGLDLDNKLSANENFFYEVGWKSNGELGNAMYLQMIG